MIKLSVRRWWTLREHLIEVDVAIVRCKDVHLCLSRQWKWRDFYYVQTTGRKVFQGKIDGLPVGAHKLGKSALTSAEHL